MEQSLFRIIDQDNQKIYDGLNQDWFLKKWNQMSGCGPTIATSMILFHQHQVEMTLTQAKEAMENVRKFVKPTIGGIYNTSLLIGGIKKYLKKENILATIKAMDVYYDDHSPLQYQQMIEFIQTGLNHHVPIAFLNLSNGNQTQLEAWHWVLISKMEMIEQEMIATVLDNTKWYQISLNQWHQTSKKNAGFVYLIQPDATI